MSLMNYAKKKNYLKKKRLLVRYNWQIHNIVKEAEKKGQCH